LYCIVNFYTTVAATVQHCARFARKHTTKGLSLKLKLQLLLLRVDYWQTFPI